MSHEKGKRVDTKLYTVYPEQEEKEEWPQLGSTPSGISFGDGFVVTDLQQMKKEEKERKAAKESKKKEPAARAAAAHAASPHAQLEAAAAAQKKAAAAAATTKPFAHALDWKRHTTAEEVNNGMDARWIIRFLEEDVYGHRDALMPMVIRQRKDALFEKAAMLGWMPEIESMRADIVKKQIGLGGYRKKSHKKCKSHKKRRSMKSH